MTFRQHINIKKRLFKSRNMQNVETNRNLYTSPECDVLDNVLPPLA